MKGSIGVDIIASMCSASVFFFHITGGKECHTTFDNGLEHFAPFSQPVASEKHLTI